MPSTANLDQHLFQVESSDVCLSSAKLVAEFTTCKQTATREDTVAKVISDNLKEIAN